MEWILPAMAAALGAVIATVLARSRARRDAAESRAQAAEALLDKADARLRETFQSLAADALKDNRASFFDLAKTSFEGYHQPIADTLKKVDERLRQSRARAGRRLLAADGAGRRARLHRQHAVARAAHAGGARAAGAKCSCGASSKSPAWSQRCDFDEQPALTGDNGRLRPDLIVHLPGRQADRRRREGAARGVSRRAGGRGRGRARARGCRRTPARSASTWTSSGSKAYWEPLDNSPEMVVMFLPGETLFSAALQHDLELIEHGLQQRVLLASPITLIALLTTVAHTWRQEALAENYREVARLGRELYERLSTFAEHFDDLRRKLDGAVQAYNEAAGSFETRVLVSARRLRDLDVTTAPRAAGGRADRHGAARAEAGGPDGMPDDSRRRGEPEIT